MDFFSGTETTASLDSDMECAGPRLSDRSEASVEGASCHAMLPSLNDRGGDMKSPGHEVDLQHWGIDAAHRFGYRFGRIVGSFAPSGVRSGACAKGARCGTGRGEEPRPILRQATRLADGADVVVQAVSSAGELPAHVVHNIVAEFELLRSLRHEAIAGASALLQTRFDCWLVLECTAYTSLQAAVDARGRFAPAAASAHIRQLLGGLAYLHSGGVTHDDIRPANLLFDCSMKSLKITNFQSARWLACPIACKAQPRASTPECVASTSTRDRTYQAPEQQLGDWDERADVWAAGLCFSFALCGGLPVDVDSQDSAPHDLLASACPLAAARAGASGASVDALAACLAAERLNRPSAAQAIRLWAAPGGE